MSVVNLTINGKAVQASAGQTIMEAARRAGIPIPHLCYHPDLSHEGSCRLCVVEVEKARLLQSSCTTPVAEGMAVWTESPRVVEARKVILDLLLSNHREDCLTCEKCGDCRLQAYAYQYGVREPSFAGARRRYPVDDGNPFFERDHEKCILCGRCVRMCYEQQGSEAIDFAYRGFRTKIAAGMDGGLESSTCVFCGNCVQVCPTGALQPKATKGQGRTWEIQKVRTTCSYCGVGCSMYLHVREGRVVGASGADGPANHNLLCVKGRFGWDYIHSPDRLTTPLVRKDGELVEATWDEALDLVAARLKEILDRDGGEAIGVLASAKCTNEENYLMQKFARGVLRTNHVDHCARLCHSATVAGLATAFGSGAMTNSIGEIENADVLLVIGSNTTETHPVIGTRVKRAVRKGARLIVADPREIELGRRATIRLQQLPGTDVALLNGLAHVIIAENLYNREFVETRTEGFAELAETVERYTPEYVEKITSIPAADLVAAARLYAGAEKAAILYAMGITQHTTGTDNVLAIANLAMLCGQVGRESTGVNPLRGQNNVQGACDMGGLPGDLPGYQKVANPEVRARFERAWGVALPDKPGLTVVEIMNAACDGKIKAMYIMGENPMLSDPDLHHAEEALKKLEFLVVQDIFLTETARLAHVVLPATTFAEKEGTFTNTERRVQLVRRAIEPVGQSRPDWEIICDLSRRLGYPMNYASPAEVMDEIAALTPSYGGISHARLGHQGLQWPCPDQGHPGTKFLHAGKFTRGPGRFSVVAFRAPAEEPDDEYPFILSTGRNLFHYHTGSMSRRSEGLNTHLPGGYVEINPSTATSLGIANGDEVLLSTRRGRVRVRALLTERTSPLVVFMPFHFAEAAANVLTNAALDPVSKIPEYKVCSVRVEKVGSGAAS